MEWISVKNKLPKKDQLVIVCYNEKEVTFGKFIEEDWWFVHGAFWFQSNKVTRWMPLPELPTNKNKHEK